MAHLPIELKDDYIAGFSYSIVATHDYKGADAKCVVHNFNGYPVNTEAHANNNESLTTGETTLCAIILAINEANEYIKKHCQLRGFEREED